MDKETIEGILRGIFRKRAGIDFACHPEQKKLPLFGAEIAIPARELVYIYFDLEREFGISIPRDAVAQGRFQSYEEVLALCEGCLASSARPDRQLSREKP